MESLHGKKCSSCGFMMLEPAISCLNCGSDSLSEIQFDGSGNIHTYTVVHVGFGKMAERAPYVLAVVELKEGLKALSILEDTDTEKVTIGLAVKFKRMEEHVGPIFIGV
jgi:uncharacterized OB-fold protein